MHRLTILLLVMVSCTTEVATPAGGAEVARHLGGWVQGGNPEALFPAAADVGFDEAFVWLRTEETLRPWIDTGARHGIGVYAVVTLADLSAWQAKYPDREPILQQMNDDENAALARIVSDKSPGKSGYQYGGEPAGEQLEVLETPLLCFHHPDVRSVLTEQVQAVARVPGLTGIALDFMGYRNYRCCRCEHSTALFSAWRAQHPALSVDAALVQFSLDTLVEFNNGLAAAARAARPDIKITCHVHPVFLAEPLYGNRLDFDSCAQSVTTLFDPPWDLERITRYTRVVVAQEKKHFARPEGVAMCYFENSVPEWPDKSAERLEQELEAVFAGGADRVYVYTMNDVVNNPQARAVFKRYFGRSR